MIMKGMTMTDVEKEEEEDDTEDEANAKMRMKMMMMPRRSHVVFFSVRCQDRLQEEEVTTQGEADVTTQVDEDEDVDDEESLVKRQIESAHQRRWW